MEKNLIEQKKEFEVAENLAMNFLQIFINSRESDSSPMSIIRMITEASMSNIRVNDGQFKEFEHDIFILNSVSDTYEFVIKYIETTKMVIRRNTNKRRSLAGTYVFDGFSSFSDDERDKILRNNYIEHDIIICFLYCF